MAELFSIILKAELFSIILKPKGPIIIPEIISPIMPGILIFPRTGEKRIINKIMANIRTGFCKGRENCSSNKLRKSFIKIFQTDNAMHAHAKIAK